MQANDDLLEKPAAEHRAEVRSIGEWSHTLQPIQGFYMSGSPEALFNAIMAEIGDSILVDFGRESLSAFPARKVEQAIRRHLGLHTSIPQTSIPQ